MIYYVEDDKNIRDLVIYTLTQTGFTAQGFVSGEDFFAAMQKQLPELVLLDIMLPGEDGLEILKALKAEHRTASLPVIMVTAKGAEYDKVLGLDSGADDYLAKPFGMMEMVSRVKALLRRISTKADVDVLQAGELTVNLKKHTVLHGKEEVTLTHKEFELLTLLFKNRGIVFNREQLLEAVWGYDYAGGTRTVDVHVQTLRQKLGNLGSMIITVRGIGYKFGEKDYVE